MSAAGGDSPQHGSGAISSSSSWWPPSSSLPSPASPPFPVRVAPEPPPPLQEQGELGITVARDAHRQLVEPLGLAQRPFRFVPGDGRSRLLQQGLTLPPHPIETVHHGPLRLPQDHSHQLHHGALRVPPAG